MTVKWLQLQACEYETEAFDGNANERRHLSLAMKFDECVADGFL